MSVTILSGAPVHDGSSTVTAVVRSFDETDVSCERFPAVTGSSWRHLDFGGSRGFEAALRGERLRSTDVDACPELPQAPALSERLVSFRFAKLSGGSGTG